MASKVWVRGAAVPAKPVWDGQRVVRDGRVAVVISGGFGGGWACFEDGAERDLMLFHPDLVAAVEAEDGDAVRKWVRTHIPDHYYAAANSSPRLSIEWVPQGEDFIIHEYDGAETVRVKSHMSWIKA